KKAIAQLNSPSDIQIIWHPFELNPTMPAQGIDRKTYRTNKFGSWAYSQQLDAQTIQAAQADNIGFRYDLMAVTPNTLKAHRLTWLASQQGKATEMAERILKAYFTEGQNIAEVAVLAQLAEEVGLGPDVVAFLNSGEGVEAVTALEQQALASEVRGVPSVRIGDQMISGAQSTETFLAALQAAAHQEV
ncbi:MAG: DsbA family oxidoreductase, partial [Cyanobacteria bacterium P01_A01_bin.135]